MRAERQLRQVSNDRKSATVTFTMPAEDLKLVVQFMTTAEAAASGLTTDSGTSATKANTDILGNVQTGDESHPALYVGIIAGAAALLIGLFAGFRKKKHRKADKAADTGKAEEPGTQAQDRTNHQDPAAARRGSRRNFCTYRLYTFVLDVSQSDAHSIRLSRSRTKTSNRGRANSIRP